MAFTLIRQNSWKKLILATLVSVNTLAVSGCAEVLIGSVLVTGIDIATDRRTTGIYIDDNAVELKVRQDLLSDGNMRGNTHVSVTSMNGIVLLTGETPNESLRERAEAIAKSYPEVRQVVNEIELGGKTALGSRANDTWLTTKVKTKLLRTPNLNARDVKVVSERGNVYLLGLVTQTESTAAVNAARTVEGVVRIIKVFEYINENA